MDASDTSVDTSGSYAQGRASCEPCTGYPDVQCQLSTGYPQECGKLPWSPRCWLPLQNRYTCIVSTARKRLFGACKQSWRRDRLNPARADKAEACALRLGHDRPRTRGPTGPTQWLPGPHCPRDSYCAGVQVRTEAETKGVRVSSKRPPLSRYRFGCSSSMRSGVRRSAATRESCSCAPSGTSMGVCSTSSSP